MLHSMTAFARQAIEAPWGSAVWELRSVNSRFLDMGIRLPEPLISLEGEVREILRKSLNRGKVEAQLRFQVGGEADNQLNINQSILSQLMKTSEHIESKLANYTPITSLDLLNWPGVVEGNEVDFSSIKQPIFDLLSLAVKDLIAMRQREGDALKQHILTRVVGMREEIKKVKKSVPEVTQSLQTKLKKTFADLDLNVDQARLEQEIVMLAQKADIAEETDRLETHVCEVERILEEGGVVGRRLDFLIQELNREANTIASKSAVVSSTLSAVELKVLIEQVREQVQNIE